MLALLALPLFAAQDQAWVERTRLPHSGAPRDDYGESVAVCGDTVLVGDPASLDSYGGDGKGAVYVFRVDGHEFSEEALLVPDDLEVNDHYGAPIALVGDTAVIGSWADDDHANASGAVYVFERSGTTWSQTAKLCASDAGDIHRFGWSLDFDGTSIIAGANGSAAPSARPTCSCATATATGWRRRGCSRSARPATRPTSATRSPSTTSTSWSARRTTPRGPGSARRSSSSAAAAAGARRPS